MYRDDADTGQKAKCVEPDEAGSSGTAISHDILPHLQRAGSCSLLLEICKFCCLSTDRLTLFLACLNMAE
jgi:hypothetical protein